MNDETMREAFEKWVLEDDFWDVATIEKNNFGAYVEEDANLAWNSWQAAWKVRSRASASEGVDTGNLVRDSLYLALDALYERGFEDSIRKRHDARGTNEWQAVLDLFRAYTRSNAKAGEVCAWTQDEDDGSWDTACGNKHEFTADGPEENQYTFCPYCGNTLSTHDKTKA